VLGTKESDEDAEKRARHLIDTFLCDPRADKSDYGMAEVQVVGARVANEECFVDILEIQVITSRANIETMECRRCSAKTWTVGGSNGCPVCETTKQAELTEYLSAHIVQMYLVMTSGAWELKMQGTDTASQQASNDESEYDASSTPTSISNFSDLGYPNADSPMPDDEQCMPEEQ